jgi:hypothetical protein
VDRRQLALVLLTALASSCTSSSSRVPPGSPSSIAPSVASPVPHTLDRAVALSCSDSGGATLNDSVGPPLALGALTFEGFSATVKDVPRAVDVGLKVPTEFADWHFRKVPVYLPARAVTVTLTMSRDIAAAFAWVPARMWISGGTPDLARWAATSVSFSGCADRATAFFGGFLADGPETCLRFRLGDDPVKGSVRKRLDGKSCSP